MRVWSDYRSALGFALAATLFAACAGVQNVTSAPLTAARTAGTESSQRRLKGDYSGAYRFTGCQGVRSGRFEVHGTGKLLPFLHSSIESGTLTQSVAASGCWHWFGTITLKSSTDRKNQILMAVRGGREQSLCGNNTSFTVTGGSGRYAEATGGGIVVFSCNSRYKGKYSNRWSGTLSL
jgi:hypothetical protein